MGERSAHPARPRAGIAGRQAARPAQERATVTDPAQAAALRAQRQQAIGDCLRLFFGGRLRPTQAERTERIDAELRDLKCQLQEHILPKLTGRCHDLHLNVRPGQSGIQYFHLLPGRAHWAPKGGVVISMSRAHHKRLRERATSTGHRTLQDYLKARTTMTWIMRPGHTGGPTVTEDLKGNLTITASRKDSLDAKARAKADGHPNVCAAFLHQILAKAA